MMSISQEYVANRLGISQAAYSNIENGKTLICKTKLSLIATALEVHVEDIVKFDPRFAMDACRLLNNDRSIFVDLYQIKKKRQKEMKQGQIKNKGV